MDGFWLLIAMGQGDARSFMKSPVLIKVIRNPPVNCSLRSRGSERRAEEQGEFRHNGSHRAIGKMAECAALFRPTRKLAAFNSSGASPRASLDFFIKILLRCDNISEVRNLRCTSTLYDESDRNHAIIVTQCNLFKDDTVPYSKYFFSEAIMFPCVQQIISRTS
jgi:hypothetical protein